MANFGFLSSVFVYLGSKDETPISENDKSEIKKKSIKDFIKALIALLFAIIFSYALKKVYEVPVYYTNIDIVTANSDNYGKVDIHIIRNYDRSDKSTSLADTLKFRNGPAGIYVNGKFKSAPHCGLNYIGSKLDSLQKVCLEERKKYTQKSLEYPQFMYVSVITSDRQMLGRKVWPDPVSEHHCNDEEDDSCTQTTDSFFNGERIIVEKNIYNDYFELGKLSEYKGGNGCHDESFYYASTKDSILSVHTMITTPALRKPPVWRTLEDVSKLVEIIEIGKRLGDSNGGIMSRITNRLTIDYVGPSEFSGQLTPVPDSITLNSIQYTDPTKIETIGRYGLRYHVNFPEMENIQESRIFILSGLATGLFALFFRYFYRCVRGVIKLSSVKKKIVLLGIIAIILVGFIILWTMLTQDVDWVSVKNGTIKD
ncbi:MAG: hypothetical protein IJ914_02230 [Prevotella sp.]|nr:hypothetical protein [Prevotella sp.]